MGNIDEKRLSALLERINNIKAELDALENEVRGLGEATEPASPVTELASPVTELAEVTEPVVRQSSPTIEATVTTEVSSAPIDDTPIEIDIQDIDIPPVLEDPAAEYAVASASSATEDIQVTEVASATEPAEVTDQVVRLNSSSTEVAIGTPTPVAGPTVPVTEPVEVPRLTETLVNQPDDDLPFDDDLPADEPSETPKPVAEPMHEPTLGIEPEIVAKQTPEPAPAPKAAILDSQKAETAVMDVMAEKQAWRTDRPGSEVRNVISAISLNDRVLLINVLFREDPILFQNTISAFNGMTTLSEAISYVQTNFPDWDMNSEPVYRLMMAVRRKLK